MSRYSHTVLFFFALILIFVLSSCGILPSGSKEPPKLVKTEFSELEGWSSKTDFNISKQAFLKSCERILTLPSGYDMKFAGKAGDWKPICHEAEISTDFKKFAETYLTPYQIYNGDKDTGKFTGYYEIELNGSLKKTPKFKYPVYRIPAGHSKPYYTREQIARGAIKDKRAVIAYVDDLARHYLLHIQGSGKIRLPSGKVLKVGYHDTNGREYTSIGRILIDHGVIEKDHFNAFTLASWIRKNPKRAEKYINKNASYVFFKLNKTDPVGAQGVVLTPYASLAVDRFRFPYGIPMWVETGLSDGKKFNQLMIAQDTGGAIRGNIRGDIYFGAGKKAEYYASTQNAPGSYYALLSKKFDEQGE
jgi:membrane-bound lytic murein transglycosylase A